MSEEASEAFDSRPALRLTPLEAIGWLGVPAFPYPEAVGAFAAEGSVLVERVSDVHVRRVDRLSFVAAGSDAASLANEFLDAADVTSDWFRIGMTEIETTEAEGSPHCVEAIAEARSDEETSEDVVLSWTVGVCVYGGVFDGLAGVEVERVLLVEADELDRRPPASDAALAGAQSSGIDGLNSEIVGWSVDWGLPEGGASSVESTVSYLVGGTVDEVASVLGDPGWQTVTSPARTTLFFGERSWVLTASGTDVVSATYSTLQ